MKTIDIISNQVSEQESSTKKMKIFYWISTSLLALLMMVGAIPDILMVPEAVEMFNHLGYPAHLLPFLGVAKTLGVIALLVPGFPRVKEWAYAGFTFDLAGAMYSGIAVGDPVSMWAPIIIGFLLIATSYTMYHKLNTNN